MKTKFSIQRSYDGSRKKAHAIAVTLAKDLAHLLDASSSAQEALILKDTRWQVGELCQRIHEMNAYWNALNTD